MSREGQQVCGDEVASGLRPARYFLSGPSNALRQTSLWIRLATLARPDSGSFHVNASGIDSFFFATKPFSPSSMPGSIAGAS